MKRLNKLSSKSLIIITFFVGLLTGGGLFFSFDYSPPAEAGDEIEFEAKAYRDVVRFKAEGGSVSRIQVEIYDLSGRRIFRDETAREVLDWQGTSDNGEQLTGGTYMYVTKAYSGGSLVKTSGIGKIFIGPDRVKLKSSPSREEQLVSDEQDLAVDKDPIILSGNSAEAHEWSISSSDSGLSVKDRTDEQNVFEISNGAPTGTLHVDSSGNLGVGSTDPEARLEVKGSSSNLLALYNTEESSDSEKFRVEKDGTVRAEGSYFGADFVADGGADVAERINTSEWVEKGNVVEIDPGQEGYFRKTKNSYSTKVAGVISSNPGVILGQDRVKSSNKGEGRRPMLALAGRVPVKVNSANGIISAGDLLVSSSKPGYAMKCEDRSKCTGAVVGKALEPFEGNSGKIMAQVTLG